MYSLAELCIIGLIFIGYITATFVVFMTIQFLVYQLTGFRKKKKKKKLNKGEI